MKKWLVIISLLVILLTVNSLAFAANDAINVSMNGKNMQVKEVGVLLDGQAFEAEVPSFIYGDRTLVPIRFVAQRLGADVSWDQSTKTATVIRGNSEIKLQIDSNQVVLNNQTKTIDNNSIPRLVTFSNNDSRTMVPVRFVSETFGYEVGWDPEYEIPYINSSDESENIEVMDLNPIITPNPDKTEEDLDAATINNVKVVKGSTQKHRIIINSDKPIKYQSLFLPDSNKLVIDIENSVLKSSSGDASNFIDLNDDYIKSLSYSQYQTNPYTTRVVAELYAKCDFDIYTSEDGKTTTVTFEEYKFDGISVEKVDGRDALVIDDMEDVQYNIMTLTSPNRVVIDLLDTNLTNKIYEYDVELGYIDNVRVSQFAGDKNYNSNDRIVRIVLDVMSGVNEANVSIDREGDKLIITPEKSIWEYISYDNNHADRYISIMNNEKTDYNVEYDYDSTTMFITIPTESTDITEGETIVGDNFINSIKVIENRDETVISINFKRGIEYDILSNKKDDTIEIVTRRDPNIPYNDKTIVIDPGHGGTDPGAISPNGIKEKDVNLPLALKAQISLEALGYDVIMTRSDDTTLALKDRVNIANRNNADIFVSIHHNSTLNSAINGLEVLYCPRDLGDSKMDEQYPLAESVSKAILANTGGIDRGIFQRPKLKVIRETYMPAILVEVGYLSNAEDEARILDGNYQNSVVQGIVNGIQNYFEMY